MSGPGTEGVMNCLLDTGRGLTPAWKMLLLTGALLTACTCSATSKLPKLEGAGTHLPVTRALKGVLSTSWFREPETQPPAMTSPKGFRGLPHISQEVPHTGDNPSLVPLVTFPVASQGVIFSDLNYSVILQWVRTMHPEPVLSWTLDGKPCGTGEKLFLRRLSPAQLGTYLCIARNSDKELVSEPVTVSLRQTTVAPTAAAPTAVYPMAPDDFLALSGGSAIGLIVVATLGGLALIGSVCYYIVLALKN
ncbi:immunoglobulin superfamily member 23 [Acomys russatus]|uniref:immunoglobulin superfamily member 23 n=1 Tax=Acomys russatus TaxID=60746 RepID=UPI0021E25C0B|nr:immunoglobulin superfamily member 23 [Acomys russatus]